MARGTRSTVSTEDEAVEFVASESAETEAPNVEDVPEDEAAPAPVARQKRAPKPVTDIATASAAFNRAKARAARADKAAVAAQDAKDAAHAALTDAATVLKGFSDEVSAAANAELPGEAVEG